MRVLDLFSGIGGFSLGLERAGMRTVAFCEIDPFCRRVLRKHWPTVPIYDDVRTLTAARLLADATSGRRDPPRARSEQEDERREADRIERFGSDEIDVICGGFPCQDISVAGKGAGISGARSGLWSEFSRIIGEVRPRYVIVENVAALLGRGLSVVLGDLAALGFDAEWHCIPASAVGAPHRRDRVWIIAHTERTGQPWRQRQERTGRPQFNGCGLFQESDSTGLQASRSRWLETQLTAADWWRTEPDVGRVAYGVSARVDRLCGLGNAVIPQIPEIIGRAILATGQTQDVGLCV